MGKRFKLLCCLLLIFFGVQAQHRFRVMEYNVENLFDCQHDEGKNDNEFLPDAPKQWNEVRYFEKLNHLSQVIAAVGEEQVPDLVGLCEVENDSTMVALTQRTALKNAGYEYVMTNSPDQRGIDVVLLYQPATFKILNVTAARVPSEQLKRPATRDQLHVTGLLQSGDTLDVFVVHMPSRAGGKDVSDQYRLFTSQMLKCAVDDLFKLRPQANVLIMGDFNDYPTDPAIAKVLGAVAPTDTIEDHHLYNLMAGRKGTYRYHGEWDVLDHIIVSGTLLQKGKKGLNTSYDNAKIMELPFLMEEDTKYGGPIPKRTYWGAKYNGGYSDHLPTCVDLHY